MPADGVRAVLTLDTDAASERLQLDLWRRMTDAGRLASALSASRATMQLALAGVRFRESAARSRVAALASLRIGSPSQSLLARLASSTEEEIVATSPLDVAVLVARALEQCGLRYVVGGSLASSLSGEPRSTIDVDIMIEIDVAAVACLLSALGADFYADADAFTRAIRSRSSVNVIHIPSATKVDLFVLGALPIEPRQMDRRRPVEIPGSGGVILHFYTPEDVLLQKLHWYALGRETSDRQWRDILGIIAVQRDTLDLAYLRESAEVIGAGPLLSRRALDTLA